MATEKRAREVCVKRLADVPVPAKQTAGSSGFDLAAAEAVIVPAAGFALVGTGIALAMPRGLEAQVRPRSGLAARSGIGVLNSPGTIDADYRGEIKVILFNCTSRPFRVRRGDRIAQLVFAHVQPVRFRVCSDLPRTRRNAGGFGHTG